MTELLTPSQQLAWASHRRHSGAAPEKSEVDTLQSFIDLLGDPKASKAKLSELAKAVAEAKEWAAKAASARAEVDQASRELTLLHGKHADAVARHSVAMEKARAELAAVQKEAAQLKAAADADRAHAAELRNRRG
jgi:chromosome segregation ATPase